jgi:hypothetical protein
LTWCESSGELCERFRRKFVGVPPERKSSTGRPTDHEKGKNYYGKIEQTYRDVEFSPQRLRRTWVSWLIPGEDNTKPIVLSLPSDYHPAPLQIEFSVCGT